VLLPGAAHVPEDDGGRGGAPRQSHLRTAWLGRARRGRNNVADTPAPKRQTGLLEARIQVGKSGRHGVNELKYENIKKDTPLLKWRARLTPSCSKFLDLGVFATADDAARRHAARAYDADRGAAARRACAREDDQLPAAGGSGCMLACRGALQRAGARVHW